MSPMIHERYLWLDKVADYDRNRFRDVTWEYDLPMIFLALVILFTLLFPPASPKRNDKKTGPRPHITKTAGVPS